MAAFAGTATSQDALTVEVPTNTDSLCCLDLHSDWEVVSTDSNQCIHIHPKNEKRWTSGNYGKTSSIPLWKYFSICLGLTIAYTAYTKYMYDIDNA